jgi:hypothetical protein
MIGFPTPGTEGAIAIRIDAARSLAQAPTWSLDTVQVGVARGSAEYERHLTATFGSSYDWSDELRFACDTGALSSFVLKTPEAGTIEPAIAASWLGVERRAGLPIVEPRATGFHIDPLDVRALSADGRSLVVLRAGVGAAEGATGCTRLAIHPTFDLLFTAESYVGWVLHDPIAALGSRDADDADAVALLRAYLALVVEPNIERMSDQDEAVGAALRELRERAGGQSARSNAARVIATRLADIIDTFYG